LEGQRKDKIHRERGELEAIKTITGDESLRSNKRKPIEGKAMQKQEW